MERVLLLGATSAIASEIATIHASRGARLHLIGRNPEKLERVVRRCEEARGASGAIVTSRAADFGDPSANEALVLAAIDELGGIDTAIVAHGDLGDQLASEHSFAEAEKTIRVNFTSVVSLILPIVNEMERRRSGRLGVIGSVAGDRGRPRNYTYGAAKGALTIYLQGVRSRLHTSGVTVTTLKLGPVDTPMTKDHEKNVFFSKPDRVARAIVRAMDARASEAYVPGFWRAIMPIVKHTPEELFQRLSFLSGR